VPALLVAETPTAEQPLSVMEVCSSKWLYVARFPSSTGGAPDASQRNARVPRLLPAASYFAVTPAATPASFTVANASSP
jgi:hypothetical protein